MAEMSAALGAAFLRRLAGLFTRATPPLAPSKESAPPPAPSSPRDIQTRLIAQGLLDPPADGVLGALSRWAMTLAAPPPLVPGDTLPGRIVRAMLARGHFIARHPECLNIVYVEGLDPDGRANDNAPNRFNDLRCLVRIDASGVPQLVGCWEATTEPSRRWTFDPMNPRGAPRIAFGQYKAWALGSHHGHEALVQVADVTVCRDANRDFKRDGDISDTGLYGINQHWGYDLPKNDLGNSSAGCLVGRTTAGHREFMRLVKTDKRFLIAGGSYRFITSVLPASEVANSE
jgi:hypothetical protein